MTDSPPTPASPPAPPVYRATRWIARLSLRLFYRRIQSIDAHYLPSTGPVVLVANHPNYMVDPLLIGAASERQVHFLAKGPLLERYPLLSRFLRAIGAVPVHRQQDDPRRMHENAGTFARCAELLAQGGVICIFAEGESHAEPRVRGIRTGAARILLEAEARRGEALGVRVVPVGLYFPHRDRYYSDGLIVFGAPLDTQTYLAQYRRAPAAITQALTRAIERRLQQLTLHVPRSRLAGRRRGAARTGAGARAGGRGAARRPGRALAPQSGDRRHDGVAAADETARGGAAARGGAGHPRPHRWSPPACPPPQRPRRPAAWPLAKAGGWPPPCRSRWVGSRSTRSRTSTAQQWSRIFVRRQEKKAFVKFVVGVPAFLLWYAAAVAWLARRTSLRGAAGVAALGPASGFIALRTREHRHRWLAAWRPVGGREGGRRAAEARHLRDALLDRFEVAQAAGRAARARGTARPARPAEPRADSPPLPSGDPL